MATSTMDINEGARKMRPCDVGRSRNSKVSKKRLHILLDPDNHAFAGWEHEPKPWTINACEKYIDWCHIDKVFPHSKHKKHCKFKAANLHRCKDAQFLERCIQVHQHLYNTRFVPRNECKISILRMVYAEERLHRIVDWRSLPINQRSPESIDIPRERKYMGEGGLTKSKNSVEPIADACVEWSDDSDVDLKSGCTKEEMDEKLKILRSAEIERFLVEVLEEEDAQVVAPALEDVGNDSLVGGPSSPFQDPITQYIDDLDGWEVNPPTLELPMMNDELLQSYTSSLKMVEDLQAQLLQQKETHNMVIETMLTEFSVKEEAYKKRIEDLEHALHLPH